LVCGDIVGLVVFFFRVEDGIRDFHVTGVQTCALPISAPPLFSTTNDCPSTSLRGWVMARAIRSAAPPAGKLTMTVTGFSGHCWADALRGLSAKAAELRAARAMPRASKLRRRNEVAVFMLVSLRVMSAATSGRIAGFVPYMADSLYG